MSERSRVDGGVAQSSRPRPRQEPPPRRASGPTAEAPRRRLDVERIIAEAFETLIGVHPIGSSDDFFALGGDSLLATQLCSRLRQCCRVDLAISAIFEHSVVEKLAAHVIGLQGASAIGDAEVLELVRSLATLDDAALGELMAQ